MHTKALSVTIMMSAAFASAQTPAEPLVGKTHDGGILIYDGICYHYADPDRFKGKGDAAQPRWPGGLDVWAVRLQEGRPTPWGSLILGPATR